MVIYDFGDFKFSDSTTGENTTTGYVNRIFVTFCDMSQKAIDTTGYGPRPCGVYTSFIRPIMEYGAIQFMGAKEVHLAKLDAVQKTAERIGNFKVESLQ